MALDANFEELEKGTGQIPLIGDAFFNGTHGDSQGNSHAYLGEGVTKTNMDIDPGLRNYTPQDLNDLFDGTADEKKLTDRFLMMTAISVMANSNGNIISDFLQNMIEEQKTWDKEDLKRFAEKTGLPLQVAADGSTVIVNEDTSEPGHEVRREIAERIVEEHGGDLEAAAEDSRIQELVEELSAQTGMTIERVSALHEAGVLEIKESEPGEPGSCSATDYHFTFNTDAATSFADGLDIQAEEKSALANLFDNAVDFFGFGGPEDTSPEQGERVFAQNGELLPAETPPAAATEIPAAEAGTNGNAFSLMG